MAGRANGDKRGNAQQRRVRKMWLLSEVSGFGGNGEKVPCVHCGVELAYDEIDVDRIVPGGSYNRDNVQPSCAFDNRSRGNKVEWSSPLVATN